MEAEREARAAARAERLSEKKMWAILKEIGVYLVFVAVVFVMAHGSRFPSIGPIDLSLITQRLGPGTVCPTSSRSRRGSCSRGTRRGPGSGPFGRPKISTPGSRATSSPASGQ